MERPNSLQTTRWKYLELPEFEFSEFGSHTGEGEDDNLQHHNANQEQKAEVPRVRRDERLGYCLQLKFIVAGNQEAKESGP